MGGRGPGRSNTFLKLSRGLVSIASQRHEPKLTQRAVDLSTPSVPRALVPAVYPVDQRGIGMIIDDVIDRFVDDFNEETSLLLLRCIALPEQGGLGYQLRFFNPFSASTTMPVSLFCDS
jgi:hypothetical protein